MVVHASVTNTLPDVQYVHFYRHICIEDTYLKGPSAAGLGLGLRVRVGGLVAWSALPVIFLDTYARIETLQLWIQNSSLVLP